MEIRFADFESFPHLSEDQQIAIVMFSEKEVKAGLTGDALARLMNLTDDKTMFERYADGVYFVFDGYDADPRELFEVPEVRRFMRALAEQWGGWFHFMVKETHLQQFSLLMTLLCDVEVIRSQGAIQTAIKDEAQFQQVLERLVQGGDRPLSVPRPRSRSS